MTKTLTEERSTLTKLTDNILRNGDVSLFYHFEPYDGPDGVAPKHTPGGAPFQKALFKSVKRMRASIANNRGGKTLGVGVEGVIMMTGELPYSCRYPDGYDTGIKRALPSQHNELGMVNIQRWGRIDKKTGEILDYCFGETDLSTGENINDSIEEDGTWDCGTIKGVGVYPKEKICDIHGKQWWVCCWSKIRDNRWLGLMKDLIPEHCLDKSRGVNGFSKKEMKYFLKDNKSISYITYESGPEKVEGEKAWLITLDEEPTQREFFTGADTHCKWMTMSWTPLHGCIWSFDDLYLPLKEGKNYDGELFHATAYDCPFFDQRQLRHLEKTLKPHEVDAKLLGLYTKREGRPYFPYELCKQYVDDYVPTHLSLSTILPTKVCDNVREVYKSSMKVTSVSERAPDVWEIYEGVSDGYEYFAAMDCARGSDNPEETQDMSNCYIFRKPDIKKGEDMEWPVMVAALYSSEVPTTFAWLCLYGCCHYNRCLMAPETKGEDGSSFATEIRDYPHLYEMTVVNDKTRKPTTKVGFDTNGRTRTNSINKIRKYINAHDQKSKLYHLQLLKEMLSLIWKRARPDHPDGLKSDCVITLAIIMWVWEEDRSQIHNNKITPSKKKQWMPWHGMSKYVKDEKKKLGRKGLGRM